jgi:hypothetical protein
MGQQDQALSSAADPAMRQPVDNGVAFFAVRQQFGPAIAATSLDNLQGIEPIAEALIKTLAGKARTGRLDEMKALELLQQAVLL